MGKLEKKEAKAPQPISSPTTRGGKSDKSLLALAPPVSESFDEQHNHHHGDVDLRMAAATIEEEIQRTAVTKMDKDSKKKAARISSHGTSAAHQDIKKRPGVVHDTKQGKEDFVAVKQRISGGSAGRRDSRKKKTGASSTEAYAPGAVLIPGINSGQFESSSNAFEDDNMNNVDDLYDKNYDDYENGLGVDDAGTFIVAAQVVDGDNENLAGGKIETKIQEEVETRLKMHNQNLVVVDAVVAVRPSLGDDGFSSQKWNQKVLGLPRKVWCLLLIVVLLVVAIVTGVVVSSKSNDPAPIDLRTLVLQNYENTSVFDNPESPQAQALEWLLQDPFSVSQRISQGINGTAKILERYALAVFYFSTDGPNWNIDFDFLSVNDTCTWNNDNFSVGNEEKIMRGALCQTAVAVELLRFNDDGLRGTLPSELSLLSDLEYLNLTSDAIVGTIPTELGRLKKLQRFNFANTSLTGTIPTEIGALTNLVLISVRQCDLEGTLPSIIGSLTALTQLHLYDNSFNGTIPTEFGRWTVLEEFKAHKNNFIGSLPVELMQWTKLTLLSVGENRLTGTLPTKLGDLTALLEIGINNNLFRGTIPTELGLLTSLEKLEVSVNAFNGKIPTELGLLSNMTIFTMNGNALTGTLPRELGNLTVMTKFDASLNNLTGTLPTELGRWNSLESFYAYENDFTGTLPTEFGAWNSVVDLSVYRNGLVGTVPTEFGRLGKLMTLDISMNALTGVLPTQLSQLSDLVQFSFYQNNFTGSVDAILCSETREWDILEADCSINGSGQVEVECSCCTACCNLNESACM